MPATPSMVMGFIAYLSDNGRAGVTITSYISAVAYFHKIQGHADLLLFDLERIASTLVVTPGGLHCTTACCFLTASFWCT